MNKYFRFFINPIFRFNIFAISGIYKNRSDECLLKRKYKLVTGTNLNLEHPQLFNEKLQWLKINLRNPLFTLMVDKYRIKKYLASKTDLCSVIELIAVFENPSQIQWTSLPNQFVIKCNHAGGVIICKDKTTFNEEKAKKQLEKIYRRDYYQHNREWPYKNVKRKVIIEKYVESKGYDVLPVYKCFCFNGDPKIIQVILNDKQSNVSSDYYDSDWTRLNMTQSHPSSGLQIMKPKRLNTMLEMCRQFSLGFPFIRIDFYEVEDIVYFSEFTFFPDGGFTNFFPQSWNKILGDWIDLDMGIEE